jgi:tetratricopeptide (TPR) repeat protein
MGNFYFNSLYTQLNQPNEKYEESWKQSYKFYFNVLEQDRSKSNIYAANGLGIVCAEKGEYEAAREIFTKVFIYTVVD